MNDTYFKLASELTFNSVAVVRDQVASALKMNSADEFYLDLSDVTHCDSAGLALLIEAKKLCQQYNKTFKIVGVSARIRSLAEFCGVNDVLETV